MQPPARKALLPRPRRLPQGMLRTPRSTGLGGLTQPAAEHSAVPSPRGSGRTSNFHKPRTRTKQTGRLKLLLNSPARVCSYTYAGGGRGAGDGGGTGGEGRSKPETLSGCFHLLSSYFAAQRRLRRQPRLLPALPPLTREPHEARARVVP